MVARQRLPIRAQRISRSLHCRAGTQPWAAAPVFTVASVEILAFVFYEGLAHDELF
jgi:hypothetical protein